VKDIEALSDLMDTKFKFLGIRFGLDGIIGLVPVVGDIATSGVSFYIVLRAFIMGFPLIVIIRMLINVFIDFVFGAVPILGNIFDFFWKANTSNVAIMKAYSTSPDRTKKRSGAFILGFALAVLSLFAVFVYLVVKILGLLLNLLF
jgi:hypothetical protein